MLDSVIRYLTVKVDEDVDVSARPSEIDDTSYEKAAQTAADEEDLFLSRGSDDLGGDDDEDDLYGADDEDDVIPGSKKPAADEGDKPSEEKE
jgi:hypothetical protein